jgi:uncharacterized membrane protein YkvA (DUF1232 family)
VVLSKTETASIACTAELKLIKHCSKRKMPQNRIVKFGLLARLFQDLKLLIPLVVDFIKGTYRNVSVKSIIIFVVAIAYIISPLDLIPDYIIGMGQIDDVAILGLSLYFLEKELRKYRAWKEIDK